jgi:NAD-dependent SIR2 family protein deacetylase
MKINLKCNIVSVGKRRDGGTRYWCLKHKADATAKYGVPAEKCRYADVPSVSSEEILNIDISEYSGGVALWGAVPPVYDTTRLPLDRGIHVHARRNPGDELKEIDNTFRMVELSDGEETRKTSEVAELDAIYYMVSSVFGYSMKYVECTRCHYPHLDRDWFSLHPHKRHLCAGCGQYFSDTEVAIGNPIMKTQLLFNNHPKPAKKVSRRIEIKQSDFLGGIQIWGSNSAMFWTSNEQEEEGIHLHAFSDETTKPALDDTFSEVIIDGIQLDSLMVRTLMVQNAIPHIQGRVISIDCLHCNKPHFSNNEFRFTPSKIHSCVFCGKQFPSKGRLRNVISNPLVNKISRLENSAIRERQIHDSNLLPETL